VVPRRQAVTQTALGPTFIVAVEQGTPSAVRLVDDHLASRFLPSIGPIIVGVARRAVMRRQIEQWSENRYPGLWGELLCRKRYGDDQLVAAVEAGLRQVVVLGAGLDTRAYRSLGITQPRTFELDLPDNSFYKQKKLVSIFGRVPDHVTLAAVDFETQDLERSLLEHGFNAEARTLFVWEAVTQYLTESAVRRTLAVLSTAASGSRLLFSYVRQDFVDGTNLWGCPALFRQFVGRHPPLWHFGLDPPRVAPFLREFGWTEREQMGESEYLARYVEPLQRRLRVTAIERFVLAVKD
jgi:methyltransferase (TIGR00027 family)